VDRRFLTEAVRRATLPGRPRLEVLGPAPSAAGSVGLVAGSFDPMTAAHAAFAEALDTELTLLVWSPATLPKEAGPGGDPSAALLLPEDRLASVAAWCGSRPWARVATCSHGLLVDQVQAAAASFPRSRLVLGMGSDKLRQLLDPAWYEDRDAALDRLFSRAEVAVASRAGDHAEPIDARWSDRIRTVVLPPGLAGLSSRAVRAAVRRGEDVSGAVPPEILPFVRGLARGGGGERDPER
jgi:nicotinic acid mononucleotide adenylyltransferase